MIFKQEKNYQVEGHCQNWFVKFRFGVFPSQSGRPVEADKDEIKALIEANHGMTTREITHCEFKSIEF